MTEIQLALTVTATIMTAGGLLLNIMNGMRKSILEQLISLDEKVDERHEENRAHLNRTQEFRHDIREMIALKPTYEYVEQRYAKKDMVEIELKHIRENISSMTEKLDILIENKNDEHR